MNWKHCIPFDGTFTIKLRCSAAKVNMMQRQHSKASSNVHILRHRLKYVSASDIADVVVSTQFDGNCIGSSEYAVQKSDGTFFYAVRTNIL